MGKVIARNVSIIVDHVELKTRAREVNVEETDAEIDVTAFGNNGYEEIEPGRRSATVTVTFFQDYTTALTHQVLYPLFRDRSAFDLEVSPDGSTTSTTNPTWAAVGVAKLFSYNFVNATVDDVMTIQATFKLIGAPTVSET